MKPILQVALDFMNLQRALNVGRAACEGGADWVEAGTPLVKSEGLDSVRRLRREYGDTPIVADMKIMDAGRMEAEAAFKAGASVVTVMGVAGDATIRQAIEAARNYGGEVMVDLMNVPDVSKRAREVERWGAGYVMLHLAVDAQMEGDGPWDVVGEVVGAVSVPVAVAGGINSETAARVVSAGAKIVIVGGAVTKAEDPRSATRVIKDAVERGESVATELFRRVRGEEVREMLERVSTPNVSDAMHRSGEITGLTRIGRPTKMVGRALTVRTYPGDWAKPVEAIDRAEKGEVLVIDAGGVGPAVWGELASESARTRGLAGVVIDGGIRDVDNVVALDLPVYARVLTPRAGEPKGFGEIGVPVMIQGRKVFTGDWMVGDASGLVVIPRADAVEITNRAMDVLERENRLRREIQEGSTLSAAMELVRWEKR